MDEPYYCSELVAPGVWKIISSGDCHFRVEGENEALMTMIRSMFRSPVLCVGSVIMTHCCKSEKMTH